MILDMLQEKNMSIYQCSKLSGIPYTTLSELVRGKTNLENVSVGVAYKLSKVLNVTIEDLLELVNEQRIDFEIFKSNVCHLVKTNGDLDYIINTLQKDEVNRYWEKKWYPEAFYILAMIDYLSRINDIPLCDKYDHIRTKSLKEPLFPKGIKMISNLKSNTDIEDESIKEAIPEFLRFNIIEKDVYNVY